MINDLEVSFEVGKNKYKFKFGTHFKKNLKSLLLDKSESDIINTKEQITNNIEKLLLEVLT